MAHKHNTQGKNKRRSLSKKRTAVNAKANQHKYNTLLVKARDATTSLVDATAVLLLAPKLFNVKPLIASGQIDVEKLRADDLLVHGRAIVANFQPMMDKSKAIRDGANTFINEVGSKVDVNSTTPEVLLQVNSELLSIHQACEQWLLDFNESIHAPLMEAMLILNDAITGKKVNLDDALAVTNALKQLTAEEKAEANDAA